MLEELSKQILKQIIRQYNLHVVLPKYTTMSKDELIKAIRSKMVYKNGELFIDPNTNVINIEKIREQMPKRKTKVDKRIGKFKSLSDEKKESIIKEISTRSYSAYSLNDKDYITYLKEYAHDKFRYYYNLLWMNQTPESTMYNNVNRYIDSMFSTELIKENPEVIKANKIKSFLKKAEILSPITKRLEENYDAYSKLTKYWSSLYLNLGNILNKLII